jgi:hypothetical protein
VSTPEEVEVARVTWAEAVDAANDANDRLEMAIQAGDSDFVIEARTFERQDASAAADVAYQAYLASMANWVTEAPMRHDFVMVPTACKLPSGNVLPSVTMGFRGGTESPVTVTLVLSELDWGRFRKEIDKAITLAIRESRKRSNDE